MMRGNGRKSAKPVLSVARNILQSTSKSGAGASSTNRKPGTTQSPSVNRMINRVTSRSTGKSGRTTKRAESCEVFDYLRNNGQFLDANNPDYAPVAPRVPAREPTPEIQAQQEPDDEIDDVTEDDESAGTQAADGNQIFCASNEGRLNPFGFAAKYLYDVVTGIPKSRQACDHAAIEFSKHPLPIDYYQYLEMAQNHHETNVDLEQVYLCMATQAVVINKALSKEKEGKVAPIIGAVSNRGFDVDEAKKAGEDVVLPLNSVFSLSAFLKTGEESDWTSTYFHSHARALVITILTRVSTADQYFPTYAAAATSPKYIPFDAEFYKVISNFVIAGFGQKNDRRMFCGIKRLVKETTRHLLDRLRKSYNEANGRTAMDSLAAQAKDRLAQGNLIRTRLIFNRGMQ